MTEAERLQKIVTAQEEEVRRMRRLVEKVRIAQVEFTEKENILSVTVSCIGIDECGFIEKTKPALEAIAKAILGVKAKVIADDAVDSVTGEKIQGARQAMNRVTTGSQHSLKKQETEEPRNDDGTKLQ